MAKKVGQGLFGLLLTSNCVSKGMEDFKNGLGSFKPIVGCV